MNNPVSVTSIAMKRRSGLYGIPTIDTTHNRNRVAPTGKRTRENANYDETKRRSELYGVPMIYIANNRDLAPPPPPPAKRRRWSTNYDDGTPPKCDDELDYRTRTTTHYGKGRFLQHAESKIRTTTGTTPPAVQNGAAPTTTGRPAMINNSGGENNNRRLLKSALKGGRSYYAVPSLSDAVFACSSERKRYSVGENYIRAMFADQYKEAEDRLKESLIAYMILSEAGDDLI